MVCRVGEVGGGNLKGEVHPKMKTSYMAVYGVLSRMVKVRRCM